MTHVNDGFDFLGFHIRRYVSGNDRPKMLVTPSGKAQARLKAKVKEMTARRALPRPAVTQVRCAQRRAARVDGLLPLLQRQRNRQGPGLLGQSTAVSLAAEAAPSASTA